MGALISRTNKRVVVVGVLGLFAYIVVGIAYHDVLRSTIEGLTAIGLLIFVSLAFSKKKTDMGKQIINLDRDEALPARKAIDNRSQEI